MNKFEHFNYPLLESCWDGYISGGEHLFNQVSNEKQTEVELTIKIK